MHGQYKGILMYADDILMSSTLNGLRKLIETVTTISKENCINFNTDKTEFCISNQNDCFDYDMRNLARDLDVDLVQVVVSRECPPIAASVVA